MAQSGYTPILIYSSSTASNAPAVGNLTNSTLGSELAINITDGKLFYKDNANAIQVIGWKTTPTTAGGTGLTSYSAGDLLYYATGTTLSKLTIGANTTVLTSSGSAPQWTAQSSLAVGTATNIAGGAAGSVPYQTGAGATSLLAIGTAYYTLGVNAGATAPSWQPSPTSVLTAQGDLLYASAANTLARLAKSATATRYLANTGTSNNPAWDQINLTNGVTGTLPAANGGTGRTSFTANYIPYGSGTAGALTESGGLVFDGTRFWVNAGSSSSSVAYIQANVNGGNGATGYIGMFHGGSNLANQTAGFMIGKTDLTMYSSYDGAGNPRNNIYMVAQSNGVVLNSGATSWAAISDERQKVIIEPIVNARQKVSQLRTVFGRYKTDAADVRRVFFLAQDFLKVLPEATNTQDKDLPTELITLQYTDALPLLAAAINELQNEFDAYKASHP